METSRALLPIIGEENTQDSFTYKQSGENLIKEWTSVEAGHNNGNSDVKSCESERTCSNMLASGRLFRYITKAIGLWNPRKKHYAMLCAFFVLLNILSLLAEIIIPSICGPFVDRCVTHKNHVTNNDSDSRAIATKIYETILAFTVWNAFSDAMTYILLIYTLRRVQQQMPMLSLNFAEGRVSSHEWLFVNGMFIACTVAITVVTAFRISVVAHSKMKFYVTFGLGVLIVYLTAFICCCVFVVMTCALCSLIDTCFQEICNMSNTSLNDITATHQKLCRQLATASQMLKPWFLVHWFMFGANCVVVFAFDSMHFHLLTNHFGGALTAFMAVAFLMNFTIFVVPCVSASRVTWKCEEFLFKVNNMSSSEWNEGHPFCERTIVNEFIFYAERSKCGFKIGKITFGSSGTWISVFLGLLGVGVRIFEYIN